jgi:NAD(P)-dependent dehydrogenase (short-subunit alcohol dehydrogenase family)
LVHEIRGFGGEITAVVADVTVFEQVKAIADLTREVYGRLDTWVHCPAIAVYSPFDQTTPEEFQRVIDVGLMGQVYGAMAALPHLKHEGRGALIHVSSVLGRRSLDFNNLTIPSVSDWLDKNPPLKWGAIAGMLALTLLAAQAFKNGGQI